MRRLCALMLATVLAATTARGERVLDDGAWKADLAQMLAAIEAHHPDPDHRGNWTALQAGAEALELRMPALDDKAIIVELAKLVALLGDAHTRLALPRQHPELALELGHAGTGPPRDPRLGFASLPVRLGLFADGLFVIAARPEHVHLVGAEVELIGSSNAEDAVQAVAAVSYADNAQTAKLMAPDRLALPELLAALGVTESAATTSLVLTRPGAAPTRHDLAPLPAGEPVQLEAPASSPEPLWLRNRDEKRYFTLLPQRSAAYAQLNELEAFPQTPLADFISETLRRAEDGDAERYVLDLRHNDGGSGSWIPAVVNALGRSRYNTYGRAYVLIGRKTFSAAQMLVNALEQYVNVVFVGEPTGSSPSHFGDSKKIELAHSGLTLRVSTIYWHSWLAGEFRDATPPHLDAAYSSTDFFGGRDPVLEAALGYRPPAGIAAQVEALFREGKIQAGAIAFLKYLNDPELEPHDAAADLVAAAHRLLDDGALDPGYYMTVLARDFYPASAPARAVQGRALELKGDLETALRRYREALELDADNAAARAGRSRLEPPAGRSP